MTNARLSRPAVSVAAIVERNASFLVVLERTRAGLCINQPAGHLEPGESLVEAAVRETLEEAAWRVQPYALVGAYRWQAPDNGSTYVRFAFAAHPLAELPDRMLDTDIVEALWLPYEEIVARRAEHRSPLVLRCIDDYRAGRRWPVDFVQDVAEEGAGSGRRGNDG